TYAPGANAIERTRRSRNACSPCLSWSRSTTTVAASRAGTGSARPARMSSTRSRNSSGSFSPFTIAAPSSSRSSSPWRPIRTYRTSFRQDPATQRYRRGTFMSPGARGAGGRFGASGDLGDQFDLDGDVARQDGDADGAAGVPAGVPEDLHQQVARPVHHRGLAVEVRCAGDEPDDLDDPDHAGQLAHLGLQRRDRVQRADPRLPGRLLRVDLGAHLPGDAQLPL